MTIYFQNIIHSMFDNYKYCVYVSIVPNSQIFIISHYYRKECKKKMCM